VGLKRMLGGGQIQKEKKKKKNPGRGVKKGTFTQAGTAQGDGRGHTHTQKSEKQKKKKVKEKRSNNKMKKMIAWEKPKRGNQKDEDQRRLKILKGKDRDPWWEQTKGLLAKKKKTWSPKENWGKRKEDIVIREFRVSKEGSTHRDNRGKEGRAKRL